MGRNRSEKLSTFQFKSLIPLCAHDVPVNYFEVVAPDRYQAQKRLALALKIDRKDLQCTGCHVEKIIPAMISQPRGMKVAQPAIF